MASIFSRKRDLMYFIFFLTHIPIIITVDCYNLWPASLRPAFMDDIREFYITTYQDQFFISPPAWFNTYIWLEALYHLPISVWAVSALLRDDPKVPLHLLVFALETAVTTLTCISDYLSWSSFSNDQKVQLAYLYVPYLALSVFMGVDMFGRLDAVLSKTGSKKKRN
ncbi:hypothetical protein BT63DRAFT_421600 [Microthyrium microscopicum]|uniref:Efficient mitochondria targeting-associated protein 19 n=1 Tax=Microthyrium microscopicum TaxID=703497 RepID=A0A6A6UNU8_9PEZI|nr:hypothetical protein BT63DRAFT_421600 [Microthyrium microscopicum]